MKTSKSEKTSEQTIATFIVINWFLNAIFFVVSFSILGDPMVSFFIACFFGVFIAGMLYYYCIEEH